MDATYSLRRGVAACEMAVSEAQIEYDFMKESLERIPHLNGKLGELKMKKMEIELEIRKEELADIQKKLDEKMAELAKETPKSD